MGLLDGLLGSQGGGLLDFLRNNAMNQQFGGGLASDQAQYGMPTMQAMAQMPQAAPQAAPQPTMEATPQVPAQSLPPALGGIGSALSRIGSPDGLIARLTGNDSRSVAQQNLKAQYDALLPMLGPQKAMLAVLNPEAGKTLIGQALEKKQYGFTKLEDGSIVNTDPQTGKVNLAYQGGGGGLTDDIKEYQFAKKENPDLTFQKFMQQKKAVSGEYSLTPQYGTDEKGNTVLIQTGKSGEAIQTKLPDGVKISSGVDKVDLGTQWGIIDKRTGQMVGTQPKDLQGKEAAEERGKQQGQAQAKIPAALIDAEETTKKIDDLLKNEGLDSIVGSVDQYRPSWALGESGRKALSQLEQLQGGAFLQAFNTLKGGGAITEIEGQKAERAIARMQRYQSEKDFREALMDFRDAVKTGVRKLQAAANAGTAPSTPTEAPKRIRLNPDGTIAQ